MAFAYPQGECFFKRSALKSSDPKGRYDAENPLRFYSCLLVEMIWNREAYHGSKECNEYGGGHSHKRSDFKMVWGGGGWQTTYGNWSHLPFSYDNYTQPSRRVQHELCTWGYRFKKREQGDAYESWFMFVPMPIRDEEWVFINRLCNIRAIYIPVAHQASEKCPDLCTYLHVAFNLHKQVTLEHHKDKIPNKFATMYDFEEVEKDKTKVDCHATFGLPYGINTAIGLSIAKLVTTLVIPRHCRNLIPVVAVQQTFTDPSMADWATVAGENHGLTIEWGKGEYKSPWFLSYLKNALVFAVGYIPIIGPFIAIGTAIAMEAIINPDELMDEVREQIPSVELTEGLIHEFKKITGLGQDAVENVDKRSTTDSADVKQSITIKPAKDDEVSTKPVDGSQPVSEEVRKESDDKVIDVPAYKALSQAEFDATVKQMAYTVVKQSFGEKVYRSFHEYKPENVTQEDIEKFLKVLENPSKEQRNANIDELIELVEGENMKQFLKGFRGYHEFLPLIRGGGSVWSASFKWTEDTQAG
ncbi:hypothetical protein TCE0_034r10049 [Talaromyces pinophilus]|uniref:Uncharacterized protein n=1 Tax=Talaromyces pinophilus TaxID=128442 RepID=A0A6V8HC59_TALPI|nr:hypothetical protein TCE0_034r10049 [Talaromyces pinophilus]